METSSIVASDEVLERERSEAERKLSDKAKYRAEAEQQVKQMQTPASLAASYRFLEELGHGGQARVYLARRYSDNRLVTIKQLNIDSVKAWKEYELFHREADVLSGLCIPGVAKFYDAIECLEDKPPCSYIIQEYIEGASLAQMLKDGHRFQTNDVYDLLLQMLKILKQLQRRDPPIIHRDIKPSNIMISPNKNDGYKVTLIDFGAVANPQVQSGGSTVAGTYGYMPPEQLMGRPQPASDIYSLGAVAVELFSGVSPANIPVKDFRLVFEPEVQQLPVAVVNTLRNMLEPKAEDRLSDIDKLIVLFEKYKNEDYDIDNIKSADVNKDRTMNRKLKEVTTICEPGNMDLWQYLPDKTPRNVPEYYLELIRESQKHTRLQNRDDDSKALAPNSILLMIFTLILIIIAIITGLTWMAISAGIITVIYTYIIINRALTNKNDIDVNEYISPYQVKSKNEALIDLIKNGRKSVAKIDSIKYLPISVNGGIKDRHGLKVVQMPPSFLVKYRFNPPDDARSEDLVHEFISHAAPENQFSPGDPLPILYKIEPKYFGDSVISMPYPYPGVDTNSAEVIFKSDSEEQYNFSEMEHILNAKPDNCNISYDYVHHYESMIRASKRSRSDLLNSIENDIWLIDDFDVLKLVIGFAKKVFSSDDYKLRAAFVGSLLKIYHYAKQNQTRELAISFLVSYFNGTIPPYKPSAAELISAYTTYTFNDLPEAFWNAFLHRFEQLDDISIDKERWNWASYRLNEIPRRVSTEIRKRTNIYY